MKPSTAVVAVALILVLGAALAIWADAEAYRVDLRVSRKTAFICGYAIGYDRAAKIANGTWDPHSLTERCRRELDAANDGPGKKLKTAMED